MAGTPREPGRAPLRGPARRRHAATRKDVARNGLPGPEGLADDVLDWVLTALAVPDAEWIFDGGTWRLVTADDDAEWFPDDGALAAAGTGDVDTGDVDTEDESEDASEDGAGCDSSCAEPGVAEPGVWTPEPRPAEVQMAARLEGRELFTAWLESEAGPQERRRVEAVLAERAAMVEAAAHVDGLRAAEVSVGRAQGAQVRVLSRMAGLYREAVHHRGPDDSGDGGDDAGSDTTSRRSLSAQRLREQLEAAGLADLVAEVALALGWTATSAGLLVRLSEHLVAHLPRTLERLESGRLTISLVKVVADHTLDLEGQLALEVDEELFGPGGSAVGLNTVELRAAVDEAVARKDAAAVKRRSRRRVAARRVTFAVLGDGIASLTVVGPAPAVLGVYEHVDAVAAADLAEARRAREEGRTPADGGDPYAVPGEDVVDPERAGDLDAPLVDRRGMAAHRFDATITALAGASPAEPGAPRPSTGLEVHAAMTTLVGVDDDPGWVEGCGWVPGWLVRQGLTWERCRLRRLLVDPFTGDLVTVDGHTYPASWLRDPGPPPPPPRSGPPSGPPSGPSSGGSPTGPSGSSPAPPTTFRGLPVQDLPPPRTIDDAFGPALPDDEPLPTASTGPEEADGADACAAGTCSPLDPRDCPLGASGRYSPGTAQDRWVRRRWQRCVHPGCTRRATRCDLDHVQAWRPGGPAAGGGTTCSCNLEPRCRAHHLLKHGTDPLTHRSADDGAWIRWSARWQQWRCTDGSSHVRSPLGTERHTRPRPAAQPAERYRLTPWPPRHPDDGLRHDHGTGVSAALLDGASAGADRRDGFTEPPSY